MVEHNPNRLETDPPQCVQTDALIDFLSTRKYLTDSQRRALVRGVTALTVNDDRSLAKKVQLYEEFVDGLDEELLFDLSCSRDNDDDIDEVIDRVVEGIFGIKNLDINPLERWEIDLARTQIRDVDHAIDTSGIKDVLRDLRNGLRKVDEEAD